MSKTETESSLLKLIGGTPSLRSVLDDVEISDVHGSFRWYVAVTLSRKEDIADINLVHQGFRAFLPRIAATRRHARSFAQIRAPLFSRYIFVELDIDQQRWRSVNGTLGIQSLIMEGERPKPVTRGVVEGLLASTDASGLIQFAPGLKPGDRVRLASGPFANSLGVLQALDAGGRVRLLLDIMHGGFRVTSSVDAIVPAESGN